MLKRANFLIIMPSAGNSRGSTIFITGGWLNFFNCGPPPTAYKSLGKPVKNTTSLLYKIPTDTVISVNLG